MVKYETKEWYNTIYDEEEYPEEYSFQSWLQGISDFISTIKYKLLEPYFNMDIYVIDQKYARL